MLKTSPLLRLFAQHAVTLTLLCGAVPDPLMCTTGGAPPANGRATSVANSNNPLRLSIEVTSNGVGAVAPAVSSSPNPPHQRPTSSISASASRARSPAAVRRACVKASLVSQSLAAGGFDAYLEHGEGLLRVSPSSGEGDGGFEETLPVTPKSPLQQHVDSPLLQRGSGLKPEPLFSRFNASEAMRVVSVLALVFCSSTHP